MAVRVKNVISTLRKIFLPSILAISMILGYYGTYHYQERIETKMEHAQTIFMNLQQYIDMPILFTNLVIINDDTINAWTDGTSVVITTGMLKFTKTDSEIAFILGHELGHVLLGHTNGVEPIFPTMNEINADKYGAYLAIRAGYNLCAGKVIWQRMTDTYGDSDSSTDGIHPSNSTREKSLDFPHC